MNSDNLQQWWENTYRHHLNQHQQPLENIGSSLIFENTTNAANTLNSVTLQQTLDENDYSNFNNLSYLMKTYNGYHDEHDNRLPTMLIIAILYGLVTFFGVTLNGCLLLTLCSASSVRMRNPLLLAVCIADLLVTGISVPATLANSMVNGRTKPLSLTMCKVIDFIQATPVAASTISFFLLSLDRYATVKHPRLAQLRQRRHLHASLAVLAWLASAIISVPFLFIYKMVGKPVVLNNTKTSLSSSGIYTSLSPPTANIPNISINCSLETVVPSTFVAFILIHTFVVFILPGLGILINHYGVRRKLCALSLTARAAHGELPLPMPILRRQTHMVIVTGIANAHQAGCGGTTDDTSNGDDIQMQNLNHHSTQAGNRNVFSSKNPISPRAMREIREHSQRQRIARAAERGRRVATPGIPLPQTSTLRSRRHLANMLMGSAFLFIICWTPHVFCTIYKIMGYSKYCQRPSNYFMILWGYQYSAFSPVIYCMLNHNSLLQTPRAPLIRIRTIQKFLRTHFRSNPVPPAPSSTNEAELGAFNPKLIKLTPKQYRAQASSHYLY